MISRSVVAAIILSGLLLPLVRASTAVETPLAGNGQARHLIITGSHAGVDVRAAAQTLADYLGRISQTTFVVTNGNGTTGIAVGTMNDFPELKLGQELNAPEPARREQYLLRSHTNGVYVVGATELAVRHAVWDLLYRFGYRQYFPGAHWEIVPTIPDLRIAVEANETPDYYFRHIWYGFGPWDHAREPYERWRQRNRMISGFGLHTGHAYEAIIRANQAAFDAHPEYLGLVNGQRTSTKLCIANPGLRQLVVNYVLKQAAANPAANTISLEPSDGGGWCECADCAKLGSITDRAVLLANEAAAALVAQHPQMYVALYAYNQHALAPTIRVHPHVIISIATKFRPAGVTTEQGLEQWRTQGGNLLGIREYFSVFLWDRALPGGARAADLGLITRTIPAFHASGARFMSAEAADSWGPNGLGYYIAARLLWDTAEAAQSAALIEDFITRCFGDARAPMQKFFELLNGTTPARMSDSLLGTMYRLLAEAGKQTSDPAVRARLDDLLLYTRYVDLFQRFDVLAGAERQTAFETLMRHTYRMRETMMVDVRALYRQYWKRAGRVQIPENARYTVPEPTNPWKSSQPFTRAELDAMLTDGLARRPVTEIAPVTFSRDLVPVTALQPPRVDSFVPVGRSRNLQRFYTWITDTAQPVRLTASSTLVGRPAEPRVAVAQLWQVSPATNTLVVAVPIPADQARHAIELPASERGLHFVEITAPRMSTQLDWPAGQPMTVALSHDSQPVVFAGRATWWFYVPQGTREVGGYQFPGGDARSVIRDGAGNVVQQLQAAAGYFRVPVQGEQAGRFWKIENAACRVLLLTVPPLLARIPAELLLPREVVENDTVPPNTP